MTTYVYDCEVFKDDWLVTFKNTNTEQFTCIWNEPEAVTEMLEDDNLYIGFNSKHYDQYIIKAIAIGLSNEDVKSVNDYLIDGFPGWEHPLLKDQFFKFNNVDIKDDMQMGLSLKAIEGHLFLPIRESNVPFDIDRPLSEEEKTEVTEYCKHDVNSTEMIVLNRLDYLQNKINLGKLAGLNEAESLRLTNAKLTARMLQAVPKEYVDERDYVFPNNLHKEHIQPEVFEFFEQLYDQSIDDDTLFKGKLEFNIGECPVTIAYGGIHGAIPNFHWNKERGRRIYNMDVASYYPHLMTINGYISRNIPSPDLYKEVLEKRMRAKQEGDKSTADALKLVCNTTYGCLLNKYNDLYDPLMGRSVCISGQLYLLELANSCFKEIEDLKIVQLNTDGIMVECRARDYDKLKSICDEWQSRTGFELEEEQIVQIAQKDVNNYIEVQPNGKIKEKGGYLVRGVSSAGAFNVNNNATIIADAIRENLINGRPVEDTINGCNDIKQFQLIAKAGTMYNQVYHEVNGKNVPTQKVNRVYASKDQTNGTLYKVKEETGQIAKIASLPDHCLIDNENECSIEDIDKQFYIELAKKRINDFKGIKPEKKKTAAKEKGTRNLEKTDEKKVPENVYQKLLNARDKFLKEGVEKSGKNMHMEFKYFELEDIVPPATRIFKEEGLIALVNFTCDEATLTIINTENPDELIDFTAPFNQIQPIISNTGKKATNEMQALGSSITYMRRYLYMIALDICEADEIDAGLGAPIPAQKTYKAPPSEKERKDIAKELAGADEQANELQIKGLKRTLKQLIEKNADYEELGNQIAIKTDSFTNITKNECEELIKGLKQKLQED